MPYSIHEPAPTPSSTLPFGRGGAGNRTRPLPPSTLKPSQPSTTTTSTSSLSPPAPNFSTGRGGIGNMQHTTSPSSSERRIFSFDEELAKQGKAAASPVYHIGRGGQGNAVNERRESEGSEASAGSEGKRGSLEWVRGLARGGKVGGKD